VDLVFSAIQHAHFQHEMSDRQTNAPVRPDVHATPAKPRGSSRSLLLNGFGGIGRPFAVNFFGPDGLSLLNGRSFAHHALFPQIWHSPDVSSPFDGVLGRSYGPTTYSLVTVVGNRRA
jgi:hypothetical protein